MKRKRTDEDAPKTDRRRLIVDSVDAVRFWDLLPDEIASIILKYLMPKITHQIARCGLPPPNSFCLCLARKEIDIQGTPSIELVSLITCRFVCRRWHSLLPLPPPGLSTFSSILATRGELAILKWARAVGSPWKAEVCTLAAGTGNLEMLKWVREHGCPWENATMEAARHFGHSEIVRWLMDQGFPLPNINNII